MENYLNALNADKIKQPAPDIQAASSSQRKINVPYVGIISDINPTSTPLSDTLVLKGQEIPKSKLDLSKIKFNPINFDNFATGGIFACGILALISLIRKIKNK